MKILRFAIPTTAELWSTRNETAISFLYRKLRLSCITQIFKTDFQSFLADRCRAAGYMKYNNDCISVLKINSFLIFMYLYPSEK